MSCACPTTSMWYNHSTIQLDTRLQDFFSQLRCNCLHSLIDVAIPTVLISYTNICHLPTVPEIQVLTSVHFRHLA